MGDTDGDGEGACDGASDGDDDGGSDGLLLTGATIGIALDDGVG